MKQNMGIADRSIRVLLAILFTLFYFSTNMQGWEVIWLILAGVMGATAIIGICPLYKMLGMDTGSGAKNRKSKTG